MLAPPVAQRQPKAATTWTGRSALQRSTSPGQSRGGGAAQVAHMLQRTIGNQALLRLLSSRSLDNEDPAIGTANDPLEQEADRVADKVTRMPDPGVSQAPRQAPCGCSVCENTGEKPQKKPAAAEDAVNAAPYCVREGLQSAHQPLDASSRTYFEQRFGRDFSHVRVHTDDRAARSAAAIGADAYTLGSHIAFADRKYDPDSTAGRHLIAHELAHILQQEDRSVSRVQRRIANHPPLAEIQGLAMPDLLAALETLERDVLLDEEAGGEVGGPRLVLAMRAVRARRERDLTSFLQINQDVLKSIPSDQYAAILTFLGQPSERERENVDTTLQVPVAIVKPSGLRLRGAPTQIDETGPSIEDPEPISEFETEILHDHNLILGAVLDPDTGEIIGYLVPSTAGMRRVVDRENRVAFETEVPIESPLLDPIDFVPSPGTVGKAAVGIGGKVIIKGAAGATVKGGAKAASTLSLGVIMRLRQASKALAKARRRAVFGARKTLIRPVGAQIVRATAPIDEKLLELAVESRTKLVQAGVSWGKSNVATGKVLVDGKTVFIAVDNPEWALHAEGAFMTEVKKLTTSGKSVQVLQVFSERIPCGPGYANCMTNLTQAFPAADIFYGVSGPMNERTTTRALHVIYGLRK